MKEILLNRMYVGKYLKENIGHEVINLFKDDNGSNYIYVNSHGRLNKKHNNIESIVLVRGIDARNMEIIAKAVNLTLVLDNSLPRNSAKANQTKYIEEHNITYGGIHLHQILKYNEGSDSDDVVYISFRAENIFYPKQKIYLTTEETPNLDGKVFFLPETTFPKQSLHWTYGDGSEAYKIIGKLLDDEELWETENMTQKISDISEHTLREDFNFLKLIRNEYDELCYSNMFHYFLTQDRNLFQKFMKDVLGLTPAGNYSIQRETAHIDLLIQDEENIVVVENKIKSSINGKKYDIYGKEIQNQLTRYREYAKDESEKSERIPKCFIFAPNYNRLNMQKGEELKHWKLINYSVLYDFFNKQKTQTKYYDEFLSALKIHAKEIDNSNFEVMQERFIETINSVK